MSPTLRQLAWFLLLCQQTLSISITCVTEESSKSGSGQNAQISVTCSNPDHTLVSCGFRHNNPTEDDIFGSWINEQTCWAKNWDNTESLGGVYAVARCCNLKAYQVTCRTLQSSISNGNDDDKIDVSCDVGETLMGCTAKSENSNLPRFDGSYPGAATDDIGTMADLNQNVFNVNKCSGWNGKDNVDGVHSYATCCKSSDSKVTFQCWTYHMDDTDATHSVACRGIETDEFMTSCSGSTAYRDINQWYVGNSDNTCYVRRAGSGTDSHASGICCSITTQSPTYTPSITPTTATTHPTDTSNAPSNNPTTSLSPTIAPSNSPTQSPSNIPSKSPTFPPSIAPSISPSITPSYSPTKSKSPTLSPTDITVNPTFAPSISPSTSPTYAPSIVPSISPSKHPTDMPTITPVTTNYTVAIAVEQCNNEQNIDINEQILHALNNMNVIITEIICDDGTVVIQLSVQTDPKQILEEDMIKGAIESEIENDNRFGNIDVEINDSSDEDQKNNDSNDMLSQIMTKQFIALMGVIVLLLIICCLLCVYYYRKRKVQKQIIKNTSVELNRISSASGKGSCEISTLPNLNIEGNGVLDNNELMDGNTNGNIIGNSLTSVSPINSLINIVDTTDLGAGNEHNENETDTSEESEMLYDNKQHQTPGNITLKDGVSVTPGHTQY